MIDDMYKYVYIYLYLSIIQKLSIFFAVSKSLQ